MNAVQSEYILSSLCDEKSGETNNALMPVMKATKKNRTECARWSPVSVGTQQLFHVAVRVYRGEIVYLSVPLFSPFGGEIIAMSL